MPDTTSAGEEPEPTGSSGSKKKMITTVVAAVVLVGVGYVLGGVLGGGSEAVADQSGDAAEPADGAETVAPEDAEAEAAEDVHVGVVVDLDAVNVNLADGHYLRVAISLGLSHDIDFGHGSPDDFPTAAASDVLLETFSGRPIADLASADGREKARHELFEGLEEHYHEDVVAVYYTEFVMQ